MGEKLARLCGRVERTTVPKVNTEEDMDEMIDDLSEDIQALLKALSDNDNEPEPGDDWQVAYEDREVELSDLAKAVYDAFDCMKIEWAILQKRQQEDGYMLREIAKMLFDRRVITYSRVESGMGLDDLIGILEQCYVGPIGGPL